MPGRDVEGVLQRLYAIAPNEPTVFSHDDLNPGNVLFSNGRLSGLVDWTDVALEPRDAAVALVRHQLAVIGHVDAAAAFLRAYEAAAHVTLYEQPMWDVLYGLRGLDRIDHWLHAFDEMGIRLTPQLVRSRSLDWIRQALSGRVE